ncbi:MAG: ATP-dependent protease subunit HslV [Candidatus Dadabacteria bacterium]|nr:MAG: ATP-dependent protease subunit HslV [Candidatus Dadabacteria bacterium]
MRATTVLAVRHQGVTVVGSDGQVTLGDTVLKHGAVKVRRLYQDRVLAGFAGHTADALTLFERFDEKLKQYSGDLRRSAVELARAWRTEKVLQRLEAMLLVADQESTLLISGNGDVLEPDENVVAIGSGGPYAHAAALALLDHSDLDAEAITRKALGIAARLCIYTNDHLSIETLGGAA